MAAKRKYNKKSEYWNKFQKKQSIEETLATNPLLQSRASNIAAQDLEVNMPKGEKIFDTQIPVSGRTKSSNRIYLNGVEAIVNEEGYFNGAALIGTDGILEIKSVDVDGNQAKITKKYRIIRYFLVRLKELDMTDSD